MHSHVQTSTTKNMHARDKYHLILKRVNPYEEKRPCAEDSIFPDKWGQESINLKQLYSKFLQGTIITWVDRMKPNRVSKALNSRHMMWIRRWHCPCFPKLWLTSCYRRRSGPLRFFTLGPLCSEFKQYQLFPRMTLTYQSLFNQITAWFDILKPMESKRQRLSSCMFHESRVFNSIVSCEK